MAATCPFTAQPVLQMSSSFSDRWDGRFVEVTPRTEYEVAHYAYHPCMKLVAWAKDAPAKTVSRSGRVLSTKRVFETPFGAVRKYNRLGDGVLRITSHAMHQPFKSMVADRSLFYQTLVLGVLVLEADVRQPMLEAGNPRDRILQLVNLKVM